MTERLQPDHIPEDPMPEDLPYGPGNPDYEHDQRRDEEQYAADLLSHQQQEHSK